MPEGFTLRKEIYRGRLPGGGVISKEEIYQQGVGCAAEGIAGGKGWYPACPGSSSWPGGALEGEIPYYGQGN